MKVIDAVWEKRNLGVETTEFEADLSDGVSEVKRIIAENEKSYNVVKIPAGNLELSAAMTEMGYTFAEAMTELWSELKNLPVLPPVAVRLYNALDIEAENDPEKLFGEDEKELFRTDRIALDPHFSVETANRRYMNWLGDEISRGTEVFRLIYKGGGVGFFALKKISPQVYDVFLGGIFEKYRAGGMGVPLIVKEAQTAADRGAARIVTHVSSNNISAMAANLAAGYRPVSVKNVFIKHNP